MKKLTVVLTTALVLSVCSTTVSTISSAHCNRYVDTNGDGICDNRGSNGCGGNFVDANGDGICDNRGSNGCGKNFVDANGDGICDNRGSNGCGKNFVDANGDGICDNAGSNGCGRRYGINYHLNGGTNNAKNPTCYYQTTQTIKLQNPTRKGYTFKGWYADKQYKKKVTAIKKGSVGKKTLYAKWKKN